MYQVILASESPRRKEILTTMGISFEAVASNVEEVVVETEPSFMVQALAELKVKDIANKIEKEKNENNNNKNNDIKIIIGADTMVFYKENALGKPKTKEDAKRMIRLLQGETHEVYTGVSIVIREEQDRFLSFSVCTKVSVEPMTEEQIDWYVKSGEPMDKAGGYGIQGLFGLFIKEIKGDYYNVVGFPISKIYKELYRRGIDLTRE